MKGKLFSCLIFCCGFLLYGAVVLANPSGHLVMPVQFSIENGDYNASVVTVKKNGAVVLSEAGKKNLRLRLEYGNNYMLSFSKPGYITKLIKVDTKVPSGFSKTGFDPYKIGVCIFKQYDGINVIVYNQPVAFVRYHPELDEFGYDVDYTKSILSTLTVAENALAKKAEEERALQKQAESSPNGVSGPSLVTDLKLSQNSVSSSTKTSDASTSGTSKTTTEKIILSDSPSINKNKEGAGDTNKNANQEGEVPAAESNPENNADQPPVTTTRTVKVISANKSSGIGGKEKITTPGVTNGNDLPKNNLSEKEGVDFKKIAVSSPTVETRTVVETVESNRTITTIRISNGEHFSEYRKVNYNWGGIYFFKDNDASISEQLFFLLSTGK